MMRESSALHMDEVSTGCPPPQGNALRINATLSGPHYPAVWLAEKAKGGSDGEVLRRFMDRAEGRALSAVRKDCYEHLGAIHESVAERMLLERDPTARQALAAMQKAADEVRRILAGLNSLSLL